MQLVVARHLENLNWLRNIPASLEAIVYDKSPEGNLPNIGREAHTYLHHITQNYSRLHDLTIFCQGKPFDHAFDFHQTLKQVGTAPESVEAFRWLGHIIDTDTPDGALFQNWSKNVDGRGLDLNGFHRALLGTEGPAAYPFYLGGQFMVRRELIKRRPLDFWQRALGISVDFPEAAHCFERSWDKVFGVVGVAPELLNGQRTVYLKTIKRLEGGSIL